MVPQKRRFLHGTIIFFFLIGILAWLLSFVHRKNILVIPAEVLSVVGGVFLFAATFFVASVIVKTTSHFFAKMIDDTATLEQKLLLRKFYSALWYFIAIVFLLWRWGASFESLTLMLGLFATGVAFALREILLSWFIWFILLTKKPFRIGDYIRIGEDEGIVDHIGTFFVVLDDSPQRREDYTRVPNKTFFDKSVHNLGRDKTRLSVSVPFIDSHKHVRKRLLAAEEALKQFEVLSGPEIIVRGDKVFVTADVLCSPSKRAQIRKELTMTLLSSL